MEHNENISKLLRLKRYEQPSPVYYETFLREFHRRQRSALMRRSVFQAMWDRISSIAPSFHVPRYAYAAIMVLALSVSALILTQQPSQPTLTAANDSSKAPLSSPPSLSLQSARPVTIGDTVPVSLTTLPPHYVLQPRPVSNEQPLSF